MFRKLLILILLAVVAAVAPTSAAVKYTMLTSADGLSNSSVNCIFQDSGQVLWFGTWDGLNAYDGYGFRTYKFAPDNANTISNNVIRNIVEESPGVIWAATDNGINRIDLAGERIERFYPGYEQNSPTAERVFSVAAGGDGDVFCAATGWGIARYDGSRHRLTPFNIPQFNQSEIQEIYDAGRHALLLLTVDHALVKINYGFTAEGEVTILDKTLLFAPHAVETMFGGRGVAYVVDTQAMVHRYDCVEGRLTMLGMLPLPARGGVRAIVENENRQVILATASSGVYRCDSALQNCIHLAQVPEINPLSLYAGSQDILWIGSDGQGVVEMYNDNIQFNKTPNLRLFDARSCPVRAFCEDSSGNLYVGTKGNGIRMLRPDGTRGSAWNSASGLGSNSVYALVRGDADDLFVGHDGAGLNVLSCRTGRISTIRPQEHSPFGSVYAICRDEANGCLWLGTNGYGLIRLQLARVGDRYEVIRQQTYVNDKSDSTSLSNNSIFAVTLAGEGKLWVGTRGGGLNLFDPRTGHFTRYTTSTGDYPISSNDILSLYLGRDSTLWIGTSYGLNRFWCDKSGQRGFRWYVERDGLPNNTIHGMMEDAAGELWLSTNKGLARLDPVTNKIVSYYGNEELQSDEFSDGAYYRCADGAMYFGGVDGFNRFDPRDIRVRTYAPHIRFNSFHIKQTPMSDFRPGEQIVLAHGENFFSIRFSALEYIRNNNCEYAYILKGFNDEWVNLGTDNTAVFTNVPPGSYEFCVRCTNGDKIWSDRTASLQIQVLPPWWNTWWAYLGYLVLMAGAFYGVWFVINDRMEQRRRLLMESLSKRRQSENHEAKLRFFTSIAHEFCTPLTLIYGSGEQMLASYKLTPEVTRHVRIIKNNAARMQRLIGELMEFRRVDTGHSAPRYGEVNVAELISTIADNFNEMNEQRRIDRRLLLPTGDAVIVSDQDALEKILYNLISNAYKYTPSDGFIHIELRLLKGRTTVQITNSGKGIKPEDLGNVFNRFEILDNFERQANEGKVMRNGIGLALAQSLAGMMQGKIEVNSTVGESTTFTLSLPEIDHQQIAAALPAEVQISLPTDEEEATEAASEGGVSTPGAVGQTVLVVDDEKQIRDLVAEVLSPEYTVVEAGDGQEAIEMLKHRRPDLIISDIRMPNLDGTQLLEYVKGNEITKYIPFVFLSFKHDLEQEIHGYEMGSEAYIAKPFHPKHLQAVVRKILHNRQSLKNYYNSVISSSDVYEGNTIDADDKKFIVQLAELIEKNITDESLSLNFLCEKMFVSRMGLYRKIKEITQMTPSEYIRSVKINHATHLLRTTNMTIQEIMFCSGFNNKSYFYREFAKIYHMSPKEMREKER